MTSVSVPTEIIESVVERLSNELRLYRSVIQKHEKLYNSSLEDFEQRLEQNGVPIEYHDLWEDSIAWRNAKEECEILEEILKRLGK